jgi:hypothetical protein
MTHLGKNTTSTIISKGISGQSQNSYRGLVRISPNADNARNFSQCDSLLMGNNCGAHTFLTSKAKNPSAKLNMRLQRVKLVKIKFSIAINVEFQPEGNRFNREWFQ